MDGNDKNTDDGATSTLLSRVIESNPHDYITVEQIKHSLHERGFGVLMAIAALPLCIPIPAPPGYTTIFSIPLFILSAQMIFGQDSPWLPKWIMRKKISRTKLSSIVEKAVPLLRKIEKLLRPRLTFAGSDIGERVIGIIAFICAASIAVPLPLTNLPPGYGILIMSLGLLSKDGLTIIIGMLIAVIGVLITAVILLYGPEMVMSFFENTSAIIVHNK